MRHYYELYIAYPMDHKQIAAQNLMMHIISSSPLLAH